jgi:hypothetical protein
MDHRLQTVREDLRNVFAYFPLACLLHVRKNYPRLIRGRYLDQKGRGCLFALLSETLPQNQRITSRATLLHFFTGTSDASNASRPEYERPKWIVRLIDGQTVERYGGLNHLPWTFVLSCLDDVIAERTRDEVLVSSPFASSKVFTDVA